MFKGRRRVHQRNTKATSCVPLSKGTLGLFQVNTKAASSVSRFKGTTKAHQWNKPYLYPGFRVQQGYIKGTQRAASSVP